MRLFLVFIIFISSLAHAAWGKFEEVRKLSLASGGIETLIIEAGAGSMVVVGDLSADEITVIATIHVPTGNDEKAHKIIASDMVLSLDKVRGKAVLKAFFENGLWNFGDSPLIKIEVSVPAGIGLRVDDGSGSITIENIDGGVSLIDGSGSVTISKVGGDLDIDDGSGSIAVRNVSGDVVIRDGSGSIKVNNVSGSVTIDDGSGSISVSNVQHDLIIEDDGSGGLSFSHIGGTVKDRS